MNRTVCFETFGCRLNRAESLEEEARYLAAGYEIVDEHSKADVIVIRGCSVTSRAQHDCEKLIDHLKRHYPAKQLVVAGCLPKLWLTANVHPPAETDRVPERTARAYLKVQDGCAGKCTFCIVPTFRGQSVSADFQTVLDKARRFVDAGYRELVVTGCNLALYASGGQRLPELVAALARLARVRLGSVEPGPVARELLHVMADTPEVCRFLHLPVQSGSPRILSAMRRPYTVADADRIIDEAVERLPGLGLGADIITGFPGEGPFDHLATVGFLKRHPFTNLHVFPYSARPGTPAIEFPGQVPHALRAARAKELSDIILHKRSAYARKFIGREVEIIVEDAERQAGWTGEYLWCETARAVRTDAGAVRKQRLKIRVTQSRHDKLIGVPAE